MSLSAWMSDNEFDWRKRLQPVKLVVETDFKVDEIREAQKRYGAAAKGLLARGESYQQIMKRFPALTLLVLVGHASLAYDQGKYWESFWEELGLRHDLDFENAIRRNLVKLFDKFSLARFPELEREHGAKYVMMLALHAGIPAHCLADLVKLINDHINQGRPAYGAAVIEWLEEPGKEHRAAALDVPVRNFLVNGAEFAVDILDRIIEFIQGTTADPALLDLELDASTTGLPSVLLDELIRLLRIEPVRFERRKLSMRGNQRPMISYNVDDDEIVLDLPAVDADASTPWRVSFDGDVRDVYSSRKWGSDTQSASVPIPAPVREIVLSRQGMASSSLPLIVKSDPLLVFDASGRWIGRRDGLKDSVWVVYPEHLHLFDPQSFDQVQPRDTGTPAGWRGWRSAFVELEDVTALQLRSTDRALIGAERWVRKDARPMFELGDPAVGVFTADGRKIYGARPWVILPRSESEPGPSWNVRVRRVGQTDWLVDCNWDAETVKTCVDPFDEAEDAQLGLFEILVTGPLGADARCVVFLAEGLEATYDTRLRIPEAGGITRCVGQIAADGMSVTPSGFIEFSERHLDRPIELVQGDTTWKALVRPPHVEIRSGEFGSPTAWRMTPDVCDPADFALDHFVAIRAPGISSVRFTYVSEHGDILQVDHQPRERSGNVFETRTQQFADVVRSHPGGRLVATLHARDAPVEVTVLNAQPRQLATGVELREGLLEFAGAANLSDLAVRIWSSTAPWEGPVVVPVVDNTAILPEMLLDAGDLRCQLFVDDPWVMIESPPLAGESAFRIEQLGWREDGTAAQRRLSRYLGTQSKPPVDVGAAPEVWDALATLYHDGKLDRFHGLIELLTGNSRKALECLGDSTIPAGDKMSMLIRSEIVNHNYAADETLNDLHSHPWFGCMVELADLPSLYHRRHKVREERAETLAYLRDRGGPALMDLLRTGKNAAALHACFDQNVFAMTAVPRAQVEAKLAAIDRVPRPQLHPENIRIGVYEAFCGRSDWLSSGWSKNYAVQTSAVLTPIRRASKLAHQAIAVRLERVNKIDASEHPWILMSAESLTLAMLARLEAHGRISGQYLNRGLLGNWATMAQLCPTMVANDLLIAEALVLHDRRGDLTGEDA